MYQVLPQTITIMYHTPQYVAKLLVFIAVYVSTVLGKLKCKDLTAKRFSDWCILQ